MLLIDSKTPSATLDPIVLLKVVMRKPSQFFPASLHSVCLVLLAFTGVAVVAPAAAQSGATDTATAAPLAATAKFATTIFSAYANGSCADISPNNYLSVGLTGCIGTAAQSFIFHPLPGSTGTYIINSAASGKCLQDYRSEVRTGSCNQYLGNQYLMWSLRAVNAAAGDYQIVQTLSSGYEQCFTATPASTPPFVIWLAACTQGSAAQTFNIQGVPQ